MTQPYLGEVRMFAGNFAPKGNALANGQLLSIAQNSALFSLLGTYYGGDGVQTFALPDIRSRIVVGFGQGPSLSNYILGQSAGTESVPLNMGQIPIHTHSAMASTTLGTSLTPGGQVLAQTDPSLGGLYFPASAYSGTAVPLNNAAIAMTGQNLPHENRMPTLAINYIVALQRIFPSRN